MIGLAKKAVYYDDFSFLNKKAAAYDSSLYYDQHPDLERLREEDEKAEEEYNQVRKEYDDGSNAAVGKGIKIGALAGMIPGAALGLAKHDLDLGFMGAATGGLLGLSAGAGIAGHHFRKQNPELHQRLWDAMDKADGAQDAHIQRWIDIDEENQRQLNK